MTTSTVFGRILRLSRSEDLIRWVIIADVADRSLVAVAPMDTLPLVRPSDVHVDSGTDRPTHLRVSDVAWLPRKPVAALVSTTRAPEQALAAALGRLCEEQAGLTQIRATGVFSDSFASNAPWLNAIYQSRQSLLHELRIEDRTASSEHNLAASISAALASPFDDTSSALIAGCAPEMVVSLAIDQLSDAVERARIVKAVLAGISEGLPSTASPAIHGDPLRQARVISRIGGQVAGFADLEALFKNWYASLLEHSFVESDTFHLALALSFMTDSPRPNVVDLAASVCSAAARKRTLPEHAHAALWALGQTHAQLRVGLIEANYDSRGSGVDRADRIERIFSSAHDSFSLCWSRATDADRPISEGIAAKILSDVEETKDVFALVRECNAGESMASLLASCLFRLLLFKVRTALERTGEAFDPVAAALSQRIYSEDGGSRLSECLLMESVYREVSDSAGATFMESEVAKRAGLALAIPASMSPTRSSPIRLDEPTALRIPSAIALFLDERAKSRTQPKKRRGNSVVARSERTSLIADLRTAERNTDRNLQPRLWSQRALALGRAARAEGWRCGNRAMLEGALQLNEWCLETLSAIEAPTPMALRELGSTRVSLGELTGDADHLGPADRLLVTAGNKFLETGETDFAADCFVRSARAMQLQWELAMTDSFGRLSRGAMRSPWATRKEPDAKLADATTRMAERALSFVERARGLVSAEESPGISIACDLVAGDVYRLIGLVSDERECFAHARQELARALSRSGRAGQSARWALAILGLARVEFAVGETGADVFAYRAGITYTNKAVEGFGVRRRPLELARSIHLMGQCQLALGEMTQTSEHLRHAKRSLRRAGRLFSRIDAPRDRIHTLIDSARARGTLGSIELSIDEAGKSLREAIEATAIASSASPANKAIAEGAALHARRLIERRFGREQLEALGDDLKDLACSAGLLPVHTGSKVRR
ncbi:MAG: hypothetical protein AAF430_21550 [Myxococcota bacterium]